MVEQDPNAGLLTPVGVPVGVALGAVTAQGFGPNGIPADLSADPVMEPSGQRQLRRHRRHGGHRQRARHRGRHHRRRRRQRLARPAALRPRPGHAPGAWAAGAPAPQQPAVLRSAWYRLPPTRSSADPLLVRRRRGPVRPRRGQSCSGPPTNRPPKNQPGGGLGFADVGAAPAWRNLRAPMSAIPSDATQVRLVATDDDLAPQHWIARDPAAHPAAAHPAGRRRLDRPVLLDWLVGLAFPCQRPFGHQNGVTEVPKWRILPDRFGAEANSPVMDYLGGGPLGITELLLRATPVPTYLKDDWFRDWGALQQLTPVVPERRSPHGSISAPRRAAGCGARRRCGSAEPHGYATNTRPSPTLEPRARPDHSTHRDHRGHRRISALRTRPRCSRSRQTTATILWPQAIGSDGLVTDVTAPLVSGAPLALDASIPCQAVATLPADRRPGVLHHPVRRASTPAATACSSAPTPTPSSSRSVTPSPPSRPARPSTPARAARCTSGPTSAASAPTSSASPARPAPLPDREEAAGRGRVHRPEGGRTTRAERTHRRRHPLHHRPDRAQDRADGARRAGHGGVDRGAGAAGPRGRAGGCPARGGGSGGSGWRPGSPTPSWSAPCCSGTSSAPSRPTTATT